MVSHSSSLRTRFGRLAAPRQWPLRTGVLTVSRTMIYVFSIVATVCAVLASSVRAETAEALYGATWVLLLGAIVAAVLMLWANYIGDAPDAQHADADAAGPDSIHSDF